MLRIRRYEPRDFDAVWELHNLALNQVGAHRGPGPWDDDFKDIPAIYFDAGGEFLVGVVEDNVVAMGALRRTSGITVEVKRLRVHPDFQRRGFGQQVLGELEARAAALGYGSLHLDTTAKQMAAQALFLKNGYVEVGRVRGPEAEMILYEKRLP